jgi:hypothetical protein
MTANVNNFHRVFYGQASTVTDWNLVGLKEWQLAYFRKQFIKSLEQFVTAALRRRDIVAEIGGSH